MPPREHALRPSLDCGYAHGRRGSPTALPCTDVELAHILCAILRTGPSSARRVRGAPTCALPARSDVEASCLTLLRARSWMADNEAANAPLHDAAARSRSREQGAHVRAHGCAGSRRRAIGEHQG